MDSTKGKLELRNNPHQFRARKDTGTVVSDAVDAISQYFSETINCVTVLRRVQDELRTVLRDVRQELECNLRTPKGHLLKTLLKTYLNTNAGYNVKDIKTQVTGRCPADRLERES